MRLCPLQQYELVADDIIKHWTECEFVLLMGTLCSMGEDGTRGPAQDEVADEALLQSRGQILSCVNM